jgi:cytochrome d ubiquinol oxidase subunit II
LLGVAVGAISSGRIRGEYSVFASAFVSPWLAPFPFAVGFFALALFAFLAAVYLTVEAGDEALREDFRLRALASAVAVGVMALAVFLLAENGAPVIRHRLTRSWWTWPLQISTAVFAVGANQRHLRGRASDVDSMGVGGRAVPLSDCARRDDL